MRLPINAVPSARDHSQHYVRRAVIVGGVSALVVRGAPARAQELMQGQPWRSSWREFAVAVDAFRREAQTRIRANPDSLEFPQTSSRMLFHGEVVPDTWAVMRSFGGQAIFEGQFDGLETDPEKLMAGQPFKINMNMNAPLGGPPLLGFAAMYIYPSTSAVDQWRSLAAGTTTRFRCRVRGISGQDMGGQYLYFVLLMNAEPL